MRPQLHDSISRGERASWPAVLGRCTGWAGIEGRSETAQQEGWIPPSHGVSSDVHLVRQDSSYRRSNLQCRRSRNAAQNLTPLSNSLYAAQPRGFRAFVDSSKRSHCTGPIITVWLAETRQLQRVFNPTGQTLFPIVTVYCAKLEILGGASFRNFSIAKARTIG